MQPQIVTPLRSAAIASALAPSWILASPGAAHAQPAPPPATAPAAEPLLGYMFDMSSIGKSFGEILKSYGVYLSGGSETLTTPLIFR